MWLCLTWLSTFCSCEAGVSVPGSADLVEYRIYIYSIDRAGPSSGHVGNIALKEQVPVVGMFPVVRVDRNIFCATTPDVCNVIFFVLQRLTYVT